MRAAGLDVQKRSAEPQPRRSGPVAETTMRPAIRPARENRAPPRTRPDAPENRSGLPCSRFFQSAVREQDALVTGRAPDQL